MRAEVFGSLALTGRGHGTDKAVLMGPGGHWPNHIDPDLIPAALARIRGEKRIRLHGAHAIAFDEKRDLVMNKRQKLPFHTNGMRFVAYAADGSEIASRDYYSVGGGSCQCRRGRRGPHRRRRDPLAWPFQTGAELLAQCERSGLSIAALMFENEKAWRSESDIRDGLRELGWRCSPAWRAASARPAPARRPARVATRADLHAELSARPRGGDARPADRARLGQPVRARGERGKTPPAARGHRADQRRRRIIPSVLHYYDHFCPWRQRTGRVRLSCSPPPRSASSTRRTPRSPAPRSAARARSAWPARWRPRA